MKDEYKILIGAIIVILIVLVGAYALSGSGGPAPTPTPTVAPTNTPTPTPVPSVVPSASPSVAPSATPVPSVTPTPMPESGIRLTEFGYWITYPPLGPQTWSGPKPKPANTVYFDPTSATMPTSYEAEAMKGDDNGYRQSYVIRSGDLNGTVNVTLHMTTSSNIEQGAHLASIDYVTYMHGENLTDLGDGDYRMTFGPDMEKQYVCVHVNPYNEEEKPKAMQALPPEGWVKVTITGADGKYRVGADKDFTVNIKNLPVVSFDVEAHGALWNNSGYVNNSTGDFGTVDASGDTVYVTLPIYRDVILDGALPVNLYWQLYSGEALSEGAVTIQPFTFGSGDDQGYVTVGIKKADILDNKWRIISIYIDDSENYGIDWKECRISINPD